MSYGSVLTYLLFKSIFLNFRYLSWLKQYQTRALFTTFCVACSVLPLAPILLGLKVKNSLSKKSWSILSFILFKSSNPTNFLRYQYVCSILMVSSNISFVYESRLRIYMLCLHGLTYSKANVSIERRTSNGF